MNATRTKQRRGKLHVCTQILSPDSSASRDVEGHNLALCWCVRMRRFRHLEVLSKFTFREPQHKGLQELSDRPKNGHCGDPGFQSRNNLGLVCPLFRCCVNGQQDRSKESSGLITFIKPSDSTCATNASLADMRHPRRTALQ